jgi:diaminopimelate decarboxylase
MPHLFLKRDRRHLLQRVKKIIDSPATDTSGSFLHVVDSMLGKKKSLLEIANNYGTPCYILDGKELASNIAAFKKAFSAHIPRAEFFYALKTNHHPFLLKKVVGAGFGLDIASARELGLGLAAHAKKFVFSGPGKTTKQLSSAPTHASIITINIDSFGELDRLGALTSRMKKNIRAGVRIHTSAHGDWQKFGIPLSDLKKFWHRARRYPFLHIEGIHSHTSLNEDATEYVNTIQAIAAYISTHFTKDELRKITFIDLGGGFYPYKTDGYYPWVIPAGEIAQIAYDQKGKHPPFIHPHYRTDAIPVESYARNIGRAIKNYLAPLLDCAYYFEPGRIISSTAMHVLLRVVDVKSKRCAILDGGNNMLGWERLSYEYFPVINLTHPAKTERPCMLYGSLCMSGKYDTWGLYYHGSKLEQGDIVVIPYQGHLTYALAQNFIHPIPPVHIMK